MVGVDRGSRIGWHERKTIIRGLAEDGRILTQKLQIFVKVKYWSGVSYSLEPRYSQLKERYIHLRTAIDNVKWINLEDGEIVNFRTE